MNLFIIVVFLSDAKMRELDYVLVITQTVFDLLVSGAASFIFFGACSFFNLGWYCAQKRYADVEHNNNLMKNVVSAFHLLFFISFTVFSAMLIFFHGFILFPETCQWFPL